MRQLRSFKDLSFNFPAPQTLSEEADIRKIASADVNKLGGRWKFQCGPDVDIYILPTKFLSLRTLKLTVERLFEPMVSPQGPRADPYPWFTPHTRQRIAALYCFSCEQQGLQPHPLAVKAAQVVSF